MIVEEKSIEIPLFCTINLFTTFHHKDCKNVKASESLTWLVNIAIAAFGTSFLLGSMHSLALLGDTYLALVVASK